MDSKLLLGKKTIRPAANTLYIGGPGCGKSMFIKKNIIAQAKASINANSRGEGSDAKSANLVVLDLEDQIYDVTRKTLLKAGYRIQYCDVMENCYNPFTYMKSDETILDFADIIAKKAMVAKAKTLNKENKELTFWYHNAKTMLTEYLMRNREIGDLSGLSMKMLYEACKNGTLHHYANESVNFDKDVVDETILALCEALEPYKDLDGKSADMIDLSTLFVQEKQAVFLEMKMMDVVPSLMYQILLGQLFHNITKRPKPLSQELLFFLDELPMISDSSWTLSINNKLPFIEANNAAIIEETQNITELHGMHQYFTRILYAGPIYDNRTARYLKSCAVKSKKSLFHLAYRDLLDEHKLMQLPAKNIYILEKGKPIIKDIKLSCDISL